MSLTDFLSPVDLSSITPKQGYNHSQLGHKINVLADRFPDLEEEKFDMAIIGVMEDRHAVNNEGCSTAPDYVREKLYQLHEGSFAVKIADLGISVVAQVLPILTWRLKRLLTN